MAVSAGAFACRRHNPTHRQTMITIAPSMTELTEDGEFRVNSQFSPEELDEIEALPLIRGPEYDDKYITLKSGRQVRQWVWRRKNERVDRVALVV